MFPRRRPSDEEKNQRVACTRSCHDAFLNALKENPNVSRSISRDWLESLQLCVENYDGTDPFSSSGHTLFVCFREQDDVDIITLVETSYTEIEKITPKKQHLRKKLENLTSEHPQSIGSIFELCVLGALARGELLAEFEPKVGTRRAEGLVASNRQNCYVECFYRTGEGPFDSHLNRRIDEKNQQLEAAAHASFLVLGGASPDGDVKSAMEYMEENGCDSISAFGRFDLQNRRLFDVWRNPNAKWPMPEALIDSITKCFENDQRSETTKP